DRASSPGGGAGGPPGAAVLRGGPRRRAPPRGVVRAPLRPRDPAAVAARLHPPIGVRHDGLPRRRRGIRDGSRGLGPGLLRTVPGHVRGRGCTRRRRLRRVEPLHPRAGPTATAPQTRRAGRVRLRTGEGGGMNRGRLLLTTAVVAGIVGVLAMAGSIRARAESDPGGTTLTQGADPTTTSTAPGGPIVPDTNSPTPQ